MCCNVLQYVAVCCSVFHCIAVGCSMLQCLAVNCIGLQFNATCDSVLQCVVFVCERHCNGTRSMCVLREESVIYHFPSFSICDVCMYETYQF